jgi:3-hydroxyacyl-CoA dehydrogenase
VDTLTGPAIGRPGTGTFRLADLVGLDTAAKVIQGIVQNCPNDEQAAAFTMPKYLDFLLQNKFFGNKSKKGFYEKSKEVDANGKPIVLALDLQTLEYKPSQKVKFPSVEAAKQVEDLPGKIRTFFKMDDAGAQLIRKSLLGLFAYVSNRVPEISDNLYSIDDALRAGFAWEAGPFEYWDMVGVQKAVELVEAEGYQIGQWVKDMLAKGINSFYTVQSGVKHYYNQASGQYEAMPNADQFVVLDNIRDKSVVWQNAECQVHHIGDQVLCVEFRSKANTIGGGVLEGLNKAIDLAENGDWRGVVIGNNAQNFSVGANLMMIAMMAYEQEYDELDYAVRMFQATTMRARYSSVPVVVATQGYVFGGGCELSMHADKVVAAAESYIGLVEVGVGLIPGGGGTKEFALRASQSFFEGDVQIPTLIEKFKTIATAGVSFSAHEAFKLGYLRKGIDTVSINGKRNISEAKRAVISLSDAGYVQQAPQQAMVLGRGGLGALYVAAESLRLGHYASEHDVKIAKKIAYVLCGGDLSSPQLVSEQYLLDIEREAFLSLCGEQKTLDRIQHMLTTNKPLRN